MPLRGYSNHSQEGKYIKLEPVSVMAPRKAISIANRFSLTGSKASKDWLLYKGTIQLLYSYTADAFQNKVHQGTMKQSGS